jgi:hypothetical protein
MAVKIGDHKAKLGQMASERSTWEPHWQELIDYLLYFFQDIITQGTPGIKKGGKLCDTTGTVAAVDFANGLYGVMNNPALPWFAVKSEIEALMEMAEVKVWLQWWERQYYNIFARSNFYTKIKEIYLGLAGLATAPLFIGEHFRHLAYFEPLNLGECFIQTNQYGEVDTLYRVFEMYPRQMQQKWGYDKLSDKAQAAIKDNKVTQKMTVVHAVEPRQNLDPERRDNQSFAYASIYFERESEDRALEEGGYREFPFCVPRFFTAPGEIYGRGPGMMALPEVKELQAMKADISQAGQLRLRPPLLLPHDGFLGPLNLTPFGENYYRSDGNPAQDRVGSFPVGGDLAYPDKELEAKRNFIRQIFFNQLFESMQDPRATLGQVLLKNQKDMERLGPFYGQLQNELFNPAFDRLNAMMERRFMPLWQTGALPPPPAALQGANLRIDYISPLAKAMRQAEAQGIINTVDFVGKAMIIDPQAKDVINLDGSIAHFAELSGFPMKLVNDEEKIQATRQQRAQQEQAQMEMQMGLEAAKAGPALAKGPEPGSPLEKLMEGAEQNG